MPIGLHLTDPQLDAILQVAVLIVAIVCFTWWLIKG